MKLIDKDAVVAEIERKEKYAQTLGDNAINGSMQQFYDGMKECCQQLSVFLDTLEVKEVDLEKESLTWEDMITIHRCIKDAMNYHLSAFQTVGGQQKVYEDILRRFKAQKGEKS